MTLLNTSEHPRLSWRNRLAWHLLSSSQAKLAKRTFEHRSISIVIKTIRVTWLRTYMCESFSHITLQDLVDQIKTSRDWNISSKCFIWIQSRSLHFKKKIICMLHNKPLNTNRRKWKPIKIIAIEKWKQKPKGEYPSISIMGGWHNLWKLIDWTFS